MFNITNDFDGSKSHRGVWTVLTVDPEKWTVRYWLSWLASQDTAGWDQCRWADEASEFASEFAIANLGMSAEDAGTWGSHPERYCLLLDSIEE